MVKRFRATCLICPWTSELTTSQVYAGYRGLRHAKKSHPDIEGFVAAVEGVDILDKNVKEAEE